MPGESYLAVLDALHDAAIDVLVCRNEGGAGMMAEAYGKLTGRPGICFVTRGPGATNASPAVHIARQDSTPMIVFVGQVERAMRGREAFQELDYRDVFGGLAKWAVEIDDAARLPEIVARAFRVAMQGRPGPVVVALPEDMLADEACVADAPRVEPVETAPGAADMATARRAGSPAPSGRSPSSAARAGRPTRWRRSRASPSASGCRWRRRSAAPGCFPPTTRTSPATSASRPTRSSSRG